MITLRVLLMLLVLAWGGSWEGGGCWGVRLLLQLLLPAVIVNAQCYCDCPLRLLLPTAIASASCYCYWLLLLVLPTGIAYSYCYSSSSSGSSGMAHRNLKGGAP